MTNPYDEVCICCEEREPLDVASFCGRCADDLGAKYFGDTWEEVSE